MHRATLEAVANRRLRCRWPRSRSGWRRTRRDGLPCRARRTVRLVGAPRPPSFQETVCVPQSPPPHAARPRPPQRSARDSRHDVMVGEGEGMSEGHSDFANGRLFESAKSMQDPQKPGRKTIVRGLASAAPPQRAPPHSCSEFGPECGRSLSQQPCVIRPEK